MQTPEEKKAAGNKARRKWNAANKDKVKEYQARYHAKHPEKRAAYQKKYYEANPEKRAEYARNWHAAHPGKRAEQLRKFAEAHPGRLTEYQLKANFGITLTGYTQMLEAQGGVCAICGKEPSKRRLGVDHDHETGEIRGLLCNQCNQMLGYAQDSVTTLQSGIDYLLKRRTSE